MMKRHLFRLNGLMGLCAVFCCWPGYVWTQQLTDILVRNDFTLPTLFVFDDIGRMYVAEKGGKIHLVDENGVRLPDPLLDISEEVAAWGDHGLTGMALDPHFSDNHHIYVYYVVDHHYLLYHNTPAYDPQATDMHMPVIGRVTRFTLDAVDGYQTVIPNSRLVILGKSIQDGPPFIHESHSTGTIVFSSDGTLLVSCGDGNTYNGSNIGGDELGGYASQALAEGFLTADQDIGSYRSQYLGSYNGKILRIDPLTGEGLPSNPFFDASDPASPASRTWSLGLRNPFRLALIPGTGGNVPEEGSPGVILIGDVGSNKREELNIATRGGDNFGWPITEGLFYNENFLQLDAPMNFLAPNPLAGQGDCSDPYLDFRQVFRRPRLDQQAPFYHPCDATLALNADIPFFTETSAALTWNNRNTFNYVETMVPTFNADGAFIPMDVLWENAPVESDTFNGFCSIAGVVYPGGPYPDKYHGAYLHADLSGWIRAIYLDPLLRVERIDTFFTQCKDIIFLALHPAEQQIWYINIAGEIRKIAYSAAPPPVAILNSDKTYGYSPLEVHFNAGESYSPPGYPLLFHWDFGDGTSSTEPQVSHFYTADPGVESHFEVQLTVTDTAGISSSRDLGIYINNTPPQVQISGLEDNARFPANSGFLLSLRAAVTDAETPPGSMEYAWWLITHHNTHSHPQIISNKALDEMLMAPLACGEDTFWYVLYLEVTDPGGLKATDALAILPYCGEPFIDQIALSALPATNGIELHWAVGFENGVFGYEIQRSSGHLDYDKIGFVPKGESNGSGYTYYFLDKHPLPWQEYRIRALHETGAFYLSNPVEAAYQFGDGFLLYPNPAEGDITLLMHRCSDIYVVAEIMTPTGSLVSRTIWSTVPGQFVMETLPTRLLPVGLYFIKISDGEREEKILLVRQ